MHRAQGYLVGVAQLFGWQVTLLGWLASRYIRAAVWLCLHSTDWSARLKLADWLDSASCSLRHGIGFWGL